MRKQTPKGTGETDTPKTEKKGTRAKSQQPTQPEIKQDGGKKTQ